MMSLPVDILKFAADHPGLVEGAVDLVKAMVAGDNKGIAIAQVSLRRRVDAEKIRAVAVVEAAQDANPVKIGRFVTARYAAPKKRKTVSG